MNHSRLQVMDLPDELLLIILKKLDTVDALLSWMGSVVRLDQIVRDPSFTAEIDLIKLNNDERCAQVDTWIDRFCSDILPAIHHQIKFSFLTKNPSYVSMVSQHWHLHLLGHHLCTNTDPLLFRLASEDSLSLYKPSMEAQAVRKIDGASAFLIAILMDDHPR